jgi:protein-disulfide isomerase
MSHSGFRIAAVLIGLVLAAAAPSALAATAPATDAPDATGGLAGAFYDGAYVMGSPKARIVVQEYASAVCPHCARFDASVFPTLKTKYIDTGKVRFEFREYLTAPADLAASAFIVARCAGKLAYFKSVEEIFKAQGEMFSGQPGTEPVVVLMRIARNNGIDAARFQACLSDKAAVTALQTRIDHAMDVDKIDATPTVLINGRKLDPGAGEWTAEKLSREIDAALKAAH